MNLDTIKELSEEVSLVSVTLDAERAATAPVPLYKYHLDVTPCPDNMSHHGDTWDHLNPVFVRQMRHGCRLSGFVNRKGEIRRDLPKATGLGERRKVLT